tara:strand:- start:1499 stop:1735 length:237 start_codon:yes stop_codon:yes gene_type:complete
MVMFVRAIIWICKEQSTRHSKVNFQIDDRVSSRGFYERIRKTKEEALSVGAAVDHHLAPKMCLDLTRGSIPVNPGFRM